MRRFTCKSHLSKLVSGIFVFGVIQLFGFVTSGTPVNAYVRVRNMNPTSIEYSTSSSGTKTTLNISFQNTPVTSLQTTTSKSIYLRRINFNRALNLSKENSQTLLIPLIIRTFTPSSTYPAVSESFAWSQFHCPTAEYGTATYGLRVNRCEIKSSNIVNLPKNGVIDNSQFFEQNLLMSEYFVEVYVEAVLGKDTNNYIDFVDTPLLSILKQGSDSIISGWQIGFSGMPYVIEPDVDPAAEELKEQNEKDEQDRNNLESQSSDIDSGGSDSQSDASSTGTSLLTAFSGFVTAITSARPTNCNIDMDMGNLDLGIVNLCQLSPPTEFQTLASIFLILFCVPLSIATARKVINLFRSFQG